MSMQMEPALLRGPLSSLSECLGLGPRGSVSGQPLLTQHSLRERSAGHGAFNVSLSLTPKCTFRARSSPPATVSEPLPSTSTQSLIDKLNRLHLTQTIPPHTVRIPHLPGLSAATPSSHQLSENLGVTPDCPLPLTPRGPSVRKPVASPGTHWDRRTFSPWSKPPPSLTWSHSKLPGHMLT